MKAYQFILFLEITSIMIVGCGKNPCMTYIYSVDLSLDTT